MNFFEHQDRARRNTTRLVGLFVLAVIGLVVCTYVLVMAMYGAGVQQMAEHDGAAAHLRPISFWNPAIFAGVAIAVVTVVGGGSLYKTVQLAGGGEPLAVSLGGRRLLGNSTDPLERKVLNVVEEMAVAAGLPVPPVYLMDNEPGINAFAAGYKPDDAVIGVTRGCIEQLTRDQLQGVIAHEFSHILNGDMRLNIRLIAIVHGILLVGLIGYYVLRAALSSGHRRSSKDKDGGAIPLFLFGLGLMVVGFAGTLIGNLIKAAVSRQREYLADASAVQFTRNPEGIAGALMRIGGLGDGSQVQAARATEASHMFFASGVSALFATHPPLDERIRRIDRFWQGERHVTTGPRPLVAPATPTGTVGFAPATAPSPEQTVDSVGTLGPRQIAHSHELLKNLPKALRDAAHEPFGACAVIYALVLVEDFNVRQEQLTVLAANAEPAVRRLAITLADITDTLPLEARLPLVEMCLGPLKGLSAHQYGRFRSAMQALIAADHKQSLFEWALQKVVLHVLDPWFGRDRPQPRRPTPVDASVVLSAMAHAGGGGDHAVQAAFDRGATVANLEGVRLLPLHEAISARIDTAIDALGRLSASSKARLLRGLAATASADGQVMIGERDLLRAIATTLDCPMPLIDE
jgi:Zn-dependent protease with chaperone function